MVTEAEPNYCLSHIDSGWKNFRCIVSRYIFRVSESQGTGWRHAFRVINMASTAENSGRSRIGPWYSPKKSSHHFPETVRRRLRPNRTRTGPKPAGGIVLLRVRGSATANFYGTTSAAFSTFLAGRVRANVALGERNDGRHHAIGHSNSKS